jgi:diguanylate cyclase (GGDEF)-like protein
VDRYKQVNDEYGHGCGDLVLQRLGALVMRSCRSTDLKCRYGGDEFVLILPETDEQGSIVFAEKLRSLVEREAFDFADQTLNITISIGVANYQGQDLNSPEQLIEAADTALLAAKRAGKNCVCSFNRFSSPTVSSLQNAAMSEACVEVRPV